MFYAARSHAKVRRNGAENIGLGNDYQHKEV
jgi:hypothetical protein